ncbi:MAG TPA: ABC transporter permease [Ktedonobacteraceae bacterium]|jgi:ribose/xylose/arabinose/galactoside ABC-type transport system permease subunit
MGILRLSSGFLRVARRSSSMILVVLVVGILLTVLTPHFLRVDNILNMLTNASVVAVVGLGMTLAIASGNFDLSVGSNAAFSSCVAFSLVPMLGIPLAILAGIITGALVGLCNGLIITELRVSAFITTLGMMTIVRGLALIYTKGQDLYLFGATGFKVLSGRPLLGIPTPMIIVLLLTLLLVATVKYTPFGRRILAIGSNAAVAKRSGIRVNIVTWGVFALVGATAALSGLIVSAQVLTANGRLDTGLELQAIAVVVIGGTSLLGGQATLVGTLLGSVLVAMINNGLNLLNVPDSYQLLTVGLLLLIAVLIEVSRGYNLRQILKVGRN